MNLWQYLYYKIWRFISNCFFLNYVNIKKWNIIEFSAHKLIYKWNNWRMIIIKILSNYIDRILNNHTVTSTLLTLCCMSSFFGCFMRDSLRYDSIVYRLIDEELIGIFLIMPSYFKIEILAVRTLYIVTDMQQRVNGAMKIVHKFNLE